VNKNIKKVFDLPYEPVKSGKRKKKYFDPFKLRKENKK